MGENVNGTVVNGTQTVNPSASTVMPEIDVPTMATPVMSEGFVEESKNTVVQEEQNAASVLAMPIFETETYKMVVGKKESAQNLLAYYRTKNPKAVKDIEIFLERFDIKNPEHIRNFGTGIVGTDIVKDLVEYVKKNKETEASEEVRAMLLDFIGDIKPRPVKLSLLQRLQGFINKKKLDNELANLEEARIDKVFEVMEKRVDSNLTQIVTQDRKDINDLLKKEQEKALVTDQYIIAGEILLERFVDEYLPEIKSEYDAFPTVENKLALKAAEEKLSDFLTRLNNVIASRALVSINVDTLLKNKEANKRVEDMLMEVKGKTLPALLQSCVLDMVTQKNNIPYAEAEQIRQITEDIFLRNAKEVGELYLATIEQSGKPFFSVETLKQVSEIITSVNAEAEKIKAERLQSQLGIHDQLMEINDGMKKAVNELAYSSFTQEEIKEFEDAASKIKLTV